jgi:integrase
MARKSIKGISLRKDGRWTKSFKGKKRYLGRGTRAEAEREFEAIVARETLGMSEPVGDDLTVQQLCTLYLKSKRKQVKAGTLSASTLTGYKRDLNWLCKSLGNRRVDSLKGYDFTLLAESIQGLKAATIDTKVTRVKAMLRWSAAQDIIPSVPSMGDFKLVRSSQKRRERSEAGSRVFSHDEASMLLEGARGVWKAILMLGLNCAMEGSEVGRLRHADIDGEWLSRARGKTGIQRTAWLWPETRELIEQYRSDHPELLFLNRRGKPFSIDTNAQCVTRPFKILKDSVGITRGIVFHAWRRTFATVASTLPVSERTIRNITAHAHRDMLHDHYIEGEDKGEIKKACEGVRFWLFSNDLFEDWRDIRSGQFDRFTDAETGERFDGLDEILQGILKDHWFLN